MSLPFNVSSIGNMPLNIHHNCKTRLQEELSLQLGTIRVENNMFIKRITTSGFFPVEDLLPNHGPLISQLESFLSESPLYDFLYGFISKRLYEELEYESEAPDRTLIELDQFSDPVTAATELIATFDSLPWPYVFTLKFMGFLSNAFEEGSNHFDISNNIRLVKPNDDFVTEYPLQSGIKGRDRQFCGKGLLSMSTPQEWDQESVYLQINTDGFVGKFVTTETTENVLSNLKSFLGLSIAVRLTIIEHSHRPAPPGYQFYIHRIIDQSSVIDDTFTLSDDFASTINDIVFNDLNGKLDKLEEQRKWQLSCLNKLRKVFSNVGQTERLLLAGQWFFDSCSGKNELLSFIQAMVSLEILLGDKATSDTVGLNELLRNRCAYLIGKDYKQREEVLKDFKDIYDIRSKIVHRGKSKLKYRERLLFGKLQWLCRRVIQEEIELISQEED